MATTPHSSDEESPPCGETEGIYDTILDMCLALLSGATRCRCVGIRVEGEGDFPLARSSGFSERFLEVERSLLPRGRGEGLSAHQRLALLECLCGKVIRDDRAGCEELFSPGGSLWLNDFSDTDKIAPEVRNGMRTACQEEGFQSFALVPCRPDDKTLGLLHVCDKRRGLLSERLLSSLEETGNHFAKLVFQLRELKSITPQLRKAEPKPQRILVVDDEVELAGLLEGMLKARAHKVTTAFSGPGALEVLRKEKFDLVVADFNMPVMNGLGLAKEIMKRWHPYAPPMVLMSGTSSEEMALAEEWPSNVAAFLRKPFSSEALIDAVHTALP